MANSRGGGDDPESTPICRCRVLYLGSAVPHVTKDGLQGIQEPLRELYPEQGALGARGIDSWLSVWSNGLLLENVDENHKKVTRFFPIDSLHYCAAVRYVLVPERAGVALGGAGGGGTLLSTSSGSGGGPSPRFLPLDSPFARTPNPSHPPLFAAILRRTTGIKVLECHAFICKREMAANALVRCCFHAYADSSYARHMDGSGGGSTYGTLRSTQGGDPATVGGGGGGGGGNTDSWRRSTLSLNHHSASAGGTLTSNASAASALSAATDDVSIYNGDENHKVWVGSGTLEREEVYGGGGSSTVRSSRSQRPRQVVAPVNAPPPPPTPKEEKAAKKAAAAAKERSRRKKLLGGSVDNLMMLNGMSGGGSLLRPHSSMSGAHHHHHQGQPQPHQHRFANGGGSLLRHANGYHHPHSHPHPHHPHHYAPAGPPPPGPPMVLATLPSRPKQAKAKAGGGKMLLAPVPVLAPVPPHHPGTGRRRHHAPMVVPVEEPVYMPSARPMSPVASFQPGHFPHEAYLMQQYATVEHPGRHAKKKAAKHKGGGPVMAPPPAVVPVPVPVPVQPPPPHVLVNGGGASPDEDEMAAVLAAEESTSPFNTGIYRKKGHLNERAFSYSIRQEHRSRSYGSLANLKFSGPDLKKEREIAQMMQDLELSSGDELERSEVPPPTHQHQRGSLRTANVRR